MISELRYFIYKFVYSLAKASCLVTVRCLCRAYCRSTCDDSLADVRIIARSTLGVEMVSISLRKLVGRIFVIVSCFVNFFFHCFVVSSCMLFPGCLCKSGSSP